VVAVAAFQERIPLIVEELRQALGWH